MLYPRFLLIFSQNKYNNTNFYNEEFLRVDNVKNRSSYSINIFLYFLILYLFQTRTFNEVRPFRSFSPMREKVSLLDLRTKES